MSVVKVVAVVSLVGLACYLATQAWRCTKNENDVVRLTSEVVALEAKLEQQKLGSKEEKQQQRLLSVRPSLSVVSFNVLVGGANGRWPHIAKWISSVNPDVVGLMECNSFTQETMERAAKQWGHEHVRIGIASSGFHVALTSRFKMEDVLVDTTNFKHALISAKIGDFIVMATHLRPEAGDLRLAELLHIPKFSANTPTILIGDLNSLSPLDAAFYSKSHLSHIADAEPHDPKDEKLKRKLAFDGKLDYRVLDVLLGEAKFLDMVHTASHGVFESTVPTKLTQDLDYMNTDHAMRLDYVLGKEVIVSGKCGAVKTAETEELSDHYPLFCELNTK